MTQKREIRTLGNLAAIEVREESSEMWVEGYAAVFNTPTVLYEHDGVEYKEQIDPLAFAQAQLSDVIFNYNHDGKVLARTRNGTLELNTDSYGLKIRARLDGTAEGRRLYEEIKGGYVDRMSFAFSIAKASYDRDERLSTIEEIKRLYDVSAVSLPAYESTSLYARSLAAAEEKEHLRRQLILQTLY